MLNDYWAPSLDTTIMAIGSAIRLFAEHPGQWDLVRADPRFISHAINEVLRLESPIQMFSRLLTDDYQSDGVTLPKGERVVVVFASANRDERKWDDPDRFDVRRRPSDHVAFGWGEHQCMGMSLARLEMRALLGALASRVRRFEITAMEPLMNNVLHGPRKLEVTLADRVRLPAGRLAGLDGEAQVAENPDRAGLPALEIAGSQPLARGELIGRAQNGFRRVAAFVPDQVIRRGGGEAVRGEEAGRTQPVVLLNRAHYVITGHRFPRHRHVLTVPGRGC